jgi:hypothetical protein
MAFITDIKKTTGIDVTKVLNDKSPRYWSQILVAFEVRHLVEHTNGKADSAFIEKVDTGGSWGQSSWVDLPLQRGSKIPIRNSDFELTCQAMIEAVRLIGDALLRFAP